MVNESENVSYSSKSQDETCESSVQKKYKTFTYGRLFVTIATAIGIVGAVIFLCDPWNSENIRFISAEHGGEEKNAQRT